MKRDWAVSSTLRLVLAGFVLAGISARADDIDEILKTEGLAEHGVQAAPAAADFEAEATPLTASPESASRLSPPSASVKAPVYTESALAAELRAKNQELVRAHAEIERLQRALVDQAAVHEQDMQRSYYNMGCVYKAARQYDRAEAEFLKVLAINPNDAAVHYNLAILYDDDLHQVAKAREHYQRFLDLAPDDKDAPMVLEWLSSLK